MFKYEYTILPTKKVDVYTIKLTKKSLAQAIALGTALSAAPLVAGTVYSWYEDRQYKKRNTAFASQ